MRYAIWTCLLLLLSGVAPAASSEYAVRHKYALGGEGGWDYLTWDANGGRLFITRGTHVIVVDAASGKQTADIPETNGVHGVALAPELGKAFVSDGRDNKVTVVDLKTLKATGTVAVGNTPDAIAYEPKTRRVFTFNARGQDATAIEAATGKVLGSIPMGGKPEFAVADGTGRLFVNNETTAELLEIDAQALTVKSRWAMKGCEEPTGLAIDEEHELLFAGCGNRVMAIVDGKKREMVATVPIGAGCDGVAFDRGTENAIASNGEGSLTVVHEDSPTKFSVAQTVPTQRGARTLTLDPATHRIFTVTAEFGPAPAPTGDNPHPRPAPVPGSFVLLVVEPK